MTVACIVQARLGSTRLPAKVLLPLPTGRTVLEEVLWRCKQIKGVDHVALAVPNEDGVSALHAHQGRSDSFTMAMGSPHDVLARYAIVAGGFHPDAVMRITADCPLIDPGVCALVLDAYHKHGAWYCSNCHPRTWPQGYDCEVFSAALLEQAHADVAQVDCPQREHVTPYIRHLAIEAGKSHNVESAGPNRSHIRWTLDTLADYATIWGVMEQQMREAA